MRHNNKATKTIQLVKIQINVINVAIKLQQKWQQHNASQPPRGGNAIYFFSTDWYAGVCKCVCAFECKPECGCEWESRGVALRAKNNVTFSGTHTHTDTATHLATKPIHMQTATCVCVCDMQRGRRRVVADEWRRKRGKHTGNKWQKICYKVSHMTEPTLTHHTRTQTLTQTCTHKHVKPPEGSSVWSWHCSLRALCHFGSIQCVRVCVTRQVDTHRQWQHTRGKGGSVGEGSLLCHRAIRVKFIFVF